MATLKSPPPVQSNLAQLREVEVVEEIRSILKVTANWMAIPLFSLFWIADLMYVPHLKWEFLGIRLLVTPACITVGYLSRKWHRASQLRSLAILYSFALASGINLMIYLIGDPLTPYYAGLFLVLIGCASFIPFRKRDYAISVVCIYLPYYAIVLSLCHSRADYTGVFTNSFFILSSIAMCFLIRFFHENLRVREIESRELLNREVEHREEVIRIKTEEAVGLATLSRQFSPQVVESIRSGKLKLEDGGTRTQICALFIDIVNSTDRVVRIDKEKVEKVLTHFLDDTIKILLKYDITIDKFLGDGILAFCNAPLTRADYIQRVMRAAIEIRQKIADDQEFYERYWQRPLEIRAGVAKGFVNVGFYGSKKYYQTYTAIGPVVNLASRLCSTADPNQIVIDWDLYEEIKNDFETKFVAKKSLKGFDADVIHVYEVIQPLDKKVSSGVNECTTCGGLLSLETTDKGHFVFVCKSCCEVTTATPKSA